MIISAPIPNLPFLFKKTMHDTFSFQRKFNFCFGRKLKEFFFFFFLNLSRELHFLSHKEKKNSFPSCDLSPFLSTISHLGLFFSVYESNETKNKGKRWDRMIRKRGHGRRQTLSRRTDMGYQEADMETRGTMCSQERLQL